MPRTYEVSGLISGIESMEGGYNRVTLQPTDEECKEVRIVFFNNIDQHLDGLNGRVVDYKEREMPPTSLTQTITGEGIYLKTTVSWEAVERFRNRSTFIPRKEKVF